MKTSRPIAIIGAGLSGLSCAKELKAMGVDVKVFEKSERPGGRCATLLWQGHLVDTAVQYFTTNSPDFKRELITQLFHFRPIAPPIMDREGNIIPNPGTHRYYTLQGNNFLGHVLAANLPIQHHCTVEKVIPLPNGEYEVQGDIYSAVVSCAPWPQTAQIFGLDASEGTSYEPCLTALIEYSGFRVGDSKKVYGSIDLKDESIIKWSACENHKAGRVVGEKTVFVVHASAGFSREYMETPPEGYLPQLVAENEKIWKITDSRKSAATGLLWRYARPLNSRAKDVELPPGLFICGDSRTESEVEKVWLDGRKAATEVLGYLQSIV